MYTNNIIEFPKIALYVIFHSSQNFDLYHYGIYYTNIQCPKNHIAPKIITVACTVHWDIRKKLLLAKIKYLLQINFLINEFVS